MPETSLAELFYNSNAAVEWRRLERQRTEFAVTVRVRHEWLPPPAREEGKSIHD